MAGALRVWGLVWAGWTALALLFASSTSLTYVSTGRSANWSLTTTRSLAEWWLWALLTPLVVWLARRCPVHGPRWRRSLAIHTLAGLTVAIAKTLTDRAIFAWLTGFWMYLLASTLALQFVVYGVVVAAAHGVEYYRRSREHEQLERRLAETRLQLLNMQLQPHFLFNTLNAIAELVHEDPEAADRMIAALSALLRRTLELGAAQEIPLRTELELLATYLEIQKTRFGDRLDVTISIDEDVRETRVPILLLQPIVENAIKHGIAARVGRGRLVIEARARDGVLVIEVSDESQGPVQAGTTPGAGIGLGNTRERLTAMYGPVATLDMASVGDHGSRATLKLPLLAANAERHPSA
jgi:two-component system, LytTR family, sensor kinase